MWHSLASNWCALIEDINGGGHFQVDAHSCAAISQRLDDSKQRNNHELESDVWLRKFGDYPRTQPIGLFRRWTRSRYPSNCPAIWRLVSRARMHACTKRNVFAVTLHCRNQIGDLWLIRRSCTSNCCSVFSSGFSGCLPKLFLHVGSQLLHRFKFNISENIGRKSTIFTHYRQEMSKHKLHTSAFFAKLLKSNK